MLIDSRLTLFPHGPSSPETQGCLREMLLHCGADHARMIETHFRKPDKSIDLDRYITYIGRLDDVKNADPPPILVITQTLLFYSNVIATRAAIVKALPTLSTAMWIIFVDPNENPFYVRNTEERGDLNDEIHNAPVWTDRETKYRYLLLTTETKDMSVIKRQASDLNQLLLSPRLRRASATLKAVCSEEIMEEARRRDSKP